MNRKLGGTLAILALALAITVSLPTGAALADSGVDPGAVVGRDADGPGGTGRDSGTGNTNPGPGGGYEGDPDTYTIDVWAGEIVENDAPVPRDRGVDLWLGLLQSLIMRIYLTLLW